MKNRIRSLISVSLIWMAVMPVQVLAAEDIALSHSFPKLVDHGGMIWSGGYSTVVIPDGQVVELTRDTVIRVDLLIINGVIRTNGWKLDVDAREIQYGPKGLITGFNGEVAEAGKDGQQRTGSASKLDGPRCNQDYLIHGFRSGGAPQNGKIALRLGPLTPFNPVETSHGGRGGKGAEGAGSSMTENIPYIAASVPAAKNPYTGVAGGDATHGYSGIGSIKTPDRTDENFLVSKETK